MERRKALGLFAATAASFTALPSFGAGTGRAANATGKGNGGYTFALDKNVKRTSVRFKNRYGIQVETVTLTASANTSSPPSTTPADVYAYSARPHTRLMPGSFRASATCSWT